MGNPLATSSWQTNYNAADLARNGCEQCEYCEVWKHFGLTIIGPDLSVHQQIEEAGGMGV